MHKMNQKVTDHKSSCFEKEQGELPDLDSYKLKLHLKILFPPKQQELVYKKLRGEPFTKTEKEYYSRIVNKKLEAIADDAINRIATLLTKK